MHNLIDLNSLNDFRLEKCIMNSYKMPVERFNKLSEGTGLCTHFKANLASSDISYEEKENLQLLP